jgi:hypothetical protein
VGVRTTENVFKVMRLVLPLLFFARMAMAVCSVETLYQAPPEPWAAITAIAGDDGSIYVAHSIEPGKTIIRRVDRATGAISEVIALDGTAVDAMVSAPPFLIFTTQRFVDTSPGHPHIVINALGPNGRKTLAESEDYPGHDSFELLRADGEFLYWFVVPTFDATGPSLTYRRDGEIHRTLLTGGKIETVAVALPLVRDFALDGNDLVLVSVDAVSRVPRSGGIPITILSDPNLYSVARADASGIWVTAIVPGEGLTSNDRAEVRRVSPSGAPVDILASLTLPRFVQRVDAVVDGDRVIFSVDGEFPRLAGHFGGLYRVENGVLTPFMTAPVWPAPIDVWRGLLYVVMPESITSGRRNIVRMCVTPTRGRVTVRR